VEKVRRGGKSRRRDILITSVYEGGKGLFYLFAGEQEGNISMGGHEGEDTFKGQSSYWQLRFFYWGGREGERSRI